MDLLEHTCQDIYRPPQGDLGWRNRREVLPSSNRFVLHHHSTCTGKQENGEEELQSPPIEMPSMHKMKSGMTPKNIALPTVV